MPVPPIRHRSCISLLASISHQRPDPRPRWETEKCGLKNGVRRPLLELYGRAAFANG
jgi:hypothetical protein